MNNQVKLELNREQVVEFLKTARADLTEDDWKDADVITVLQWALPTYQKWTNYGTWNDTPPVPTIKPGDSVYHKRFKAQGKVKKISASGKRAYVVWFDGYVPSYVSLDSLEVVE